jgi:hypothetical protein
MKLGWAVEHSVKLPDEGKKEVPGEALRYMGWPLVFRFVSTWMFNDFEQTTEDRRQGPNCDTFAYSWALSTYVTPRIGLFHQERRSSWFLFWNAVLIAAWHGDSPVYCDLFAPWLSFVAFLFFSIGIRIAFGIDLSWYSYFLFFPRQR